MADIKTVGPAANTPAPAAIPAANIEPGTEGAPHTGLIEPHSPAANALPNSGASGIINPGEGEKAPMELDFPATYEQITTAGLPQSQHPNDVKFKVKYAKDFKGAKTLGDDGTIQIVSKETAEHFTKLGMGSIVK